MSWVRPDQEFLPHTAANAQLNDAVMVVVSRKLGGKYRTNRVLNPGPVVCDPLLTEGLSVLQDMYVLRSACPQLLPSVGDDKLKSHLLILYNVSLINTNDLLCLSKLK